ncbi:uncharacterized protein LOC142345476 [Convolutriloba macropyga]|uniref:uncharacterized protein LOC142345476 n=1 Tax=Convolutriloba macropyga TaxID=536237 RepID=UPI003F52400F
MDGEKAAKLQKATFHLIHNMRCAEKAAQYLYSNKEMSMQTRDEIREESILTEKNRILLNNVKCRDSKAYDLLYESLYINDEIPLCQLLWLPSLGEYPQPRDSAPVVPLTAYNEQLERQGMDVRFRSGEDPTPGGDVIDLKTF